MTQQGLVVESVANDSIAAELGVEPGDVIAEIGGHPVRDIIDYRFYICDEELSITLLKSNGEEWILDIEKDFDDDLGIDFGLGGIGNTRRCQNRCMFCFVDQMPPNLRKTLYVKDDDYRLSFLQGNFITLSNLGQNELERIARQRLSPLYVSVHTTNPRLREKVLNNSKAGRIMEQINYLAQAGIEMHTQVVLCPGVNDGAELERTVRDLSSLWPAVRSLAVVPVGLTAYRQGLFPLRTFNREEAREIIAKIKGWQEACRFEFEYPWVFASDEFYLIADVSVPPAKDYADFPQTENGVGLVRLFLDDWQSAAKTLPASLEKPMRVTVATGILGSKVLATVIKRLNLVNNLQVELAVIENKFFGPMVTVAGLLTGSDLKRGLQDKQLGQLLIIPSVMLRSGELVFLDDVTVEELSDYLKTPVVVAEGPEDLIRYACNINDPLKASDNQCQNQL